MLLNDPPITRLTPEPLKGLFASHSDWTIYCGQVSTTELTLDQNETPTRGQIQDIC